jgi:esterase/lipase
MLLVMRRLFTWVFAVFIFLSALFILGPRVPVDARIGDIILPADLDTYLAESEATYPDIVPGAEKVIYWAEADKSKTPLSIVYLHGYSASRQETVPLGDNIAARLGANIYYNRFKGHGRGGEAMATATVNDWFVDTKEALEIGKRIGEKVIVLSVSTGGTTAAWLAQQPGIEPVHCFIMISPNFAPRDGRAEILTWPWGSLSVRLMAGREYSFKPANEQQAKYWTHRYPSSVLPVMSTMVKYVRHSDLEAITKPVLFIYSIHDTVIDTGEVVKAFKRLASPEKQIHRIEEKLESGNHVLAGDILASDNTQHIESMILEFIDSLE